MQRGYPTANINTASDFEVFFNNTFPKAKHVSISSWHELAAHVLVSQLTSVVGTLNSVAPVNYINPSPLNGYLELPVSHCRVLLSGSLSLSPLNVVEKSWKPENISLQWSRSSSRKQQDSGPCCDQQQLLSRSYFFSKAISFTQSILHLDFIAL